MKLLTITCDRDFEETILQARSIQKYLASTTHLIIVNNSVMPEDKWVSALSPFYDRHELKIEFSYDYQECTGWVSQQILKIRAVHLLDDDYVILDAKNFFIKPTDISSWTQHGSGKALRFFDTGRIETMRYYCEKIGQPYINEFYNIITPFVVKKELMLELDRYKDILLEDFYDSRGNIGHSEFMLYSILMKKHNIPFATVGENYPANGISITFFKRNEPINVEQTINLLKRQDMYVMSGIHPNWWGTAFRNEKILLIEWLKSLDILVPEYFEKFCRPYIRPW